ncbi:MAG TPA: deoxyribose-phosphate aldolase [Candidatus Bilophila faecipullorum]|uniref:Deoxyribose-phosphate aldolase n=1 Tax=Candidatus Bilophila faecipullorum TaxID=2838482 RepID=A0A9D1U9T9_9BACT|nr:deoxyribose-phosphate aldolase [uncultured Bilophila sp.]HIW78540.1 deoxyribose-phosphate aldolase [Candidatus Bilophila faecipullorum]
MQLDGIALDARDAAARIDHTVLAPDATRADMEKACAVARSYGFRAVFTNPYWSPLVAELLDGSGIAAGISAAFPLGSISTESKVREVMDVVERLDGKPCAVDMVTNIGLLKEKRYADYTADIRAVVRAVQGRAMEVKAILETSLLTPEEIRAACLCAAEASADYAKTSTGRAGAPSLEHIAIMKAALPPSVGVKFSGFGTLNAPELAICAFALGADLLGSPCGDVIVDALSSRYAALRVSLNAG